MLVVKIISGFAAMAMGAAVVLLFPGVSPDADASTAQKPAASTPQAASPVEVVISIPVKVVKTERTDTRPIGRDCSEQAWPYYEASCLRDPKRFAGKANTVRVVTTDRLASRVTIERLAAK